MARLRMYESVIASLFGFFAKIRGLVTFDFCNIILPITAVTSARRRVRFSNRPFGVKRFQTIHHYSVDVARGLVLLFGIGTRALPSWDSRTRRNNLLDGLTARRAAGPSGHTISPHPSSREGHLSTTRWSSIFLRLDLASV